MITVQINLLVRVLGLFMNSGRKITIMVQQDHKHPSVLKLKGWGPMAKLKQGKNYLVDFNETRLTRSVTLGTCKRDSDNEKKDNHHVEC